MGIVYKFGKDMPESSYYSPTGGLPSQSNLLTDRSVFTEAYAVITKKTNTDIVASFLPFWTNMRMWVLARPLSGFAETFSHYIVELGPNGGSQKPELDVLAEAVIFVVEGKIKLTVGKKSFDLFEGGYAYLPAGEEWNLENPDTKRTSFHWIRKRFQAVKGLASPEVLIANEKDILPSPMPGTDGRWVTTRFVDPEDMRYDMHVNIVTFQPGAVIPFSETHVMEHGLYILQGKGVYRLNSDWVEVEAGDYIWLRSFCPQACYAGGPEPFRYLLYKDVNRHMSFL